ncbi:hypothetical protein KSP40_PGU000535 [Platanthera guangdongensis]|uniref:Uncharacterized protein n=1 Tax=Platanthera guangdongensis TaxID=2320717 RepID=A0ABR2LN90_9ASPA
MDLLLSYVDGESPEESLREPVLNSDPDDCPSSPNSSSDSPPHISLPAKTSAPRVDDTALALTAAVSDRSIHRPLDPSQHAVGFNPTYDQLWAPIYGPAHPYAKDGIAQGMHNHKLSFVEDASIQSFLFDEQYNTFHKYGYAADPSGLSYVGDVETLERNQAFSVYNIPQQEQNGRRLELKSADTESDDPVMAAVYAAGSDVENPAASEWLLKKKKSPWSGKKDVVQGELTEEQKKHAEEYAKKKSGKGREGKGEKTDHVDKTTFHGKEESDYQGRSWVAPPKDAKPSNDHCYIPKSGPGDCPSSPDSSSDSPTHISLPAKTSAPCANDTALVLTAAVSDRSIHLPLDPSQHIVGFNPTYDQLWAPIYGPAHPYAKDGIAQGMRNHKLYFVEDASIQSFLFDEQYNTFHKYGHAADPSGLSYIGDIETLQRNQAFSVYNIPQQ